MQFFTNFFLWHYHVNRLYRQPFFKFKLWPIVFSGVWGPLVTSGPGLQPKQPLGRSGPVFAHIFHKHILLYMENYDIMSVRSYTKMFVGILYCAENRIYCENITNVGTEKYWNHARRNFREIKVTSASRARPPRVPHKFFINRKQ